MAAAAAGPAAPNNCVLCVLEPTAPDAMLLTLTNSGGIEVVNGGIVVNSRNDSALRLLGSGDVTAQQIRVIGGALDPVSGGQLLPPAEEGGPPAVDPLADLRPPNQVDTSLVPGANTAQVITTDTPLPPGVYPNIDVQSGTLHLQEGVYVVTDAVPGRPGFAVRSTGRVEGDGVTIYLACQNYPTPCGGNGTGLLLENNGEFAVSPPTSGEYAGLSIFADKGNTSSIQLLGAVDLPGAIYAASGHLVVNPPDPDPDRAVRIGGLVAVDRLLKDGAGQLEVTYNPASPLIGIGRPVLIR
jgi:hypothetical protein